ncbi:transmembrane protein 54b isoform X4 [Sander vitreus]
MAGSGVCCASLEEPKSLMKMGLCMVLVGHVNFLLGALVHGVVLRHINLNKQAWAMEYAISNVVALTSGLIGILVGILAIVLSKNKKSRGLSTTLILWVPLIVTCVTQTVFSSRCSAVCISFLGLPCCPTRKRSRRDYGRAISVVRPMEEVAPSRYNDPPRSYTESPTCYNDPPSSYNDPPRSYTQSPTRYAEPPRSYRQPPRRNTEPPRQHHRPPPPPQRLPHQHRSLPPSERGPLHQPHRERSDEERLKTRVGSQQRPPQQHQLLERGTHERSSFWI